MPMFNTKSKCRVKWSRTSLNFNCHNSAIFLWCCQDLFLNIQYCCQSL
jgi:hypothetical protein